jgi:hypothetical protein
LETFIERRKSKEGSGAKGDLVQKFMAQKIFAVNGGERGESGTVR